MARHFFGRTLFWLFLSHIKLSVSLKPLQYCFYACNSATYQLVFEGSANACVNEYFYKTNYYCAAVHCSEAELNAALGEFNNSCDGLLPAFDSVIGPTDLRTIPSISYAEAPTTASQPLSHAVIPDPAFYEIAFDSVVSMIGWAMASSTAKLTTVRLLYCIQYRLLLLVWVLRILGPGHHRWHPQQNGRGMALPQAVEADKTQQPVAMGPEESDSSCNVQSALSGADRMVYNPTTT